MVNANVAQRVAADEKLPAIAKSSRSHTSSFSAKWVQFDALKSSKKTL